MSDDYDAKILKILQLLTETEKLEIIRLIATLQSEQAAASCVQETDA